MANANIIQRARVITDSMADDVAKAYARRAPGARGPVTMRDIPEDVAVKMVETIKEVAPAAARKRVANRFAKKSYALVGGGAIAGGTIFNLDDLGFIDALLSLTPDGMREVVQDAAEVDASADTSVAEATQTVGDLIYQHDLHNIDYDAHRKMLPLDRTVQSTVGVQIDQVNSLQALTDVLELAINATGGLDALEAIILISNNTTPEDRAALYDNLKYKRGY